MKFHNSVLIFFTLSLSIVAKAQYQPLYAKEIYWGKLSEESDEIKIHILVSKSIYVSESDLWTYIDNIIRNTDYPTISNFEVVESYEQKLSFGNRYSVLGFFSPDDTNEIDRIMLGHKILMKIPRPGFVKASIYDIVLKTSDLDKFVPDESFISDNVALNKDKTQLIDEKADYRMAISDILSNTITYINKRIDKYSEEHKASVINRKIEVADSLDINNYKEISSNNTRKDDSSNSQIKTSFGDGDIMPDYVKMINDLNYKIMDKVPEVLEYCRASDLKLEDKDKSPNIEVVVACSLFTFLG